MIGLPLPGPPDDSLGVVPLGNSGRMVWYYRYRLLSGVRWPELDATTESTGKVAAFDLAYEPEHSFEMVRDSIAELLGTPTEIDSAGNRSAAWTRQGWQVVVSRAHWSNAVTHLAVGRVPPPNPNPRWIRSPWDPNPWAWDRCIEYGENHCDLRPFER